MKERKEGGFIFGNYRSNQSIPIGAKPSEEKEKRARSSGGAPVFKEREKTIIPRPDEMHELQLSKTPLTFKGELNMKTIERLENLLNQGMTVRQAADVMSAKASTLNQYFYQLKREKKIDGTPDKPIVKHPIDAPAAEDEVKKVEDAVADSVSQTLNADVPKEQRMDALVKGINQGLDRYKEDQAKSKPPQKKPFDQEDADKARKTIDEIHASLEAMDEGDYSISNDLIIDYQKKVDALKISDTVIERIKQLHSAGATVEGIAQTTLVRSSTVREVIVLTTLKENKGKSKKELKRAARKLLLDGHETTFVAMVTAIPYERVLGIFNSLKEQGHVTGTANAPVIPDKEENGSQNTVPERQNESMENQESTPEEEKESFTAAEMTPPEIKEQEYIKAKTNVVVQDLDSEFSKFAQDALSKAGESFSEEAAITTEAPVSQTSYLTTEEERLEKDARKMLHSTTEDEGETEKDDQSSFQKPEITLDEALDDLSKTRKKIMYSGISPSEFEDKYMEYQKKSVNFGYSPEDRLVTELIKRENVLIRKFKMRLYDINPSVVRRFISTGKSCGYPLVEAMKDFDLTIEEAEELGFWEIGQKIGVVEFNENLTDIPNRLEAEFDGDEMERAQKHLQFVDSNEQGIHVIPNIDVQEAVAEQIMNQVQKELTRHLEGANLGTNRITKGSHNGVIVTVRDEATESEYLQAEASKKVAAELAKTVDELSIPLLSNNEVNQIVDNNEPEERIFIDTKLSVQHRRVSVATVRKHIEKMLSMVEMTGELADVNFELSTARPEEDGLDNGRPEKYDEAAE